MEGNGLPFFGPSVEFSTVQPIESQRVLNYFNQFVAHSVELLNKFSVICDSKLLDLDFRIQNIEATLAILEAKLASVPSLETTIPSTPVQTASSVPSSEVPASLSLPCNNSAGRAPNLIATLHDVPVVQQEAEGASVDPQVLRFQKMLAVGVPLMAVEQKMRAEGLDPRLLKSPASATVAAFPTPPRRAQEPSGSEEEGQSSISDQD